MSKALTWWELFQLSGREIARNKSRIWGTILRQGQKNGGRLCCFLAIALMWLWNWKLLLATAVGIGGMRLAFLVQERHWQQHWAKWQRFLNGFNRQLLVAVASGSMGAFSTYLAASIWSSADDHWLAVGSILQGFAGLITILLLLWLVVGSRERYQENKWDKLQSDLTHHEPLKRLIAIHKLTCWLQTKNISPEYSHQYCAYFYLMLGQPQEPLVRQALIDSLERLENSQISPKSLKLPLRLQQQYSKQLG